MGTRTVTLVVPDVRLAHLGYGVAALICLALLFASLTQAVPLQLTEVLAFITGAGTVWLTVKQNLWLWPIGIANNVFFIVLFFQARLYADMALQVVYIGLAILGWYWWLHGGLRRSALRVSRASLRTLVACLVFGVVATWGMTLYLASIDDAAPFLDALTTVLSLIAQYLLSRKLIENWLVWMTADVIYIGLYLSRDLQLTAVLYAIFLTMCVVGLLRWRVSLREAAPPPVLRLA